MSGVKIVCPKCGRILGDTNESIKATLNCRGCKQAVQVKMKIASFKDYVRNYESKDERAVRKGE